MITTVLLFGVTAALAEILGGMIVLSRSRWPKKTQEMLLALGAGFIMALVFFKLLPISVMTLGETAALYLVAGFSLIHFFEHSLVRHLHFGEETHTHVMVSRVASISAFSGLFVHAFFDGFSISVGMQFDFVLGLLVFCGVLLHKVPEGLTIGSIMLAGGYSRNAVLFSAVGIGVATILGTSSIFVLSTGSRELVGIALAITAGAALYVGASDLIPEINKSERRIPPFIVFVGMALYYVSEQLLQRVVN